MFLFSSNMGRSKWKQLSPYLMMRHEVIEAYVISQNLAFFIHVCHYVVAAGIVSKINKALASPLILLSGSS